MNTPTPAQPWHYSAMDLASCTCANLRKAMRATTQVFDAALQPIGLTATQFTVLAVLSKVGDVPLGRLAETMVTDRTTLTRNLKPMTDRGLIRIAPGQDRRIREVALTNRGRFILEEAVPLWHEIQARMVAGLGEPRWSRLLDDLAATVDVASR